MSTSNRLDDLVAQLQLVRDEDLASESRSPNGEALFERIVADLDGAARSSKPIHDPPRRGRRWLAAAAAALVGVVVLLAIDVGPSPEVVTPAAAALGEAAESARAQDRIPPGRYLYVRSANVSLAFGYVPVDPSGDPEDARLECCEALVPQVREMWLGDQTGDALLHERSVGDPEFLSDEERERWIQLGRPELEAKTPFSGILAGVPPRAWYDGPLDLPSDADAMYEQFEQDAERDTRQPGVPFDVHVRTAMFHHFSDVLREARATPEQRAAAYEALARVPGLTLVGEVTDRLGRPGVAVGLDVVDNEPSGFLYRYVLVFDPKTADLLEERREVLPGNRHRGLPAGTIEAYATYEYAVVGALGEPPRD
jgi:hypothetical protein